MCGGVHGLDEGLHMDDVRLDPPDLSVIRWRIRAIPRPGIETPLVHHLA